MSSTPDIFLSYSRDDQATARYFAEGFERAGFSVWWDVTLNAGEDYDQVTEQALRGAKAVVVLWSAKSVASRWVRTEATIALQSKTLVPVMIEPCQRPIMFELTQTAELGHWQGDADDNVWRTFLSDVQRFVHKEASTAATATVQMPAASVSAVRLPKSVKPSRWHRLLPQITTLVAVGTLVGLGVWHFKPAPALAPQPLNRFAYSIPADQSFRRPGVAVMALSPDSRHFVYNTSKGLYLRTLGELEARLIPGTEDTLANPFFAPDGQSIAYEADGLLKRIGINGGAPLVIDNTVGSLGGASWGPGDVIVFARDHEIYRVSANGGTPELLISGEGLEAFGQPQMLPDGDTVLFSVKGGTSWDQAQIVAQSLSTGVRTVLVQAGSNGHYLPTGHLVYALGDGLFAIAFDPATLTVSGGVVPLVQGLLRADISDSANYGIGADGTLVYVSSSGGAERHSLVWVSRDGSEELINVPARNYIYAQLSPDGTRVALDSRDEENDIWVFDLARESLQRLTFDPGLNRAPVWSPDGTRIVSSRQLDNSEDIYWQAADGSGTAEALTSKAEELGATLVPTSFVPDGSAVVFNVDTDAIWLASIDGTAANSAVLIDGAASEHNAVISPDGRWIAYQSNESGSFEIYVRPFPDVNSGRWQISSNGGTQPDWSADGSELFYLELDGEPALMAVPIASASGFTPGVPKQLFGGNFLAPNTARQVYDVANDGQRFLMIKNAARTEAATKEIIIVQNFVAELQRLVPLQQKD